MAVNLRVAEPQGLLLGITCILFPDAASRETAYLRMKDELEGNGRGLFGVLSQNLPRATEEYYGIRQDRQCPGRHSKPSSPEHET
jgi:hypothetical protein